MPGRLQEPTVRASNPITSPFPSLHRLCTCDSRTTMYPHEDIVQPRDRRAWTDDEDELLRAAIEKGMSDGGPLAVHCSTLLIHGPSLTEDSGANPPSKWHAIAKHIPNRTNKDCRKRWWAQMATRVSKGSWSADEDERLFSAVEELGTKWAAVASRVGTRNSGQCAKRWNDALNPAIDRSGWTPEEDQQLLQAVQVQGHSWANIARTYLPGRTGLAAKNRYNHLIRGSSDRSPSTRARRMSAATAMRRRNTRGSSASSTSSPSSPRSTVTPPPSSSSGSSSPGSSGTPPTPDGYPMQQSLDYMGNWHQLKSEASLFDDLPGLSHSGSTSRSSPSFSYSASSPTDSQALNMFMHPSFGDFLDPSIDPSAALATLSPTTLSLASCSPGTLLPETVDPWSAVHYSFTDFNGHNIPMEPSQLAPSGTNNVNNTPSLCQPQYTTTTGLTLGRFMHSMQQESPISFGQFGAGAGAGPGAAAALQDRTTMHHLLQQQIDPHDHATSMTLGMCDPYDVSSSLHQHAFHVAH
ncbi:hypothetical protein BDY19DRAFT_937849 [Irpex rosettiformis]|uniref:Uncharacterized protein n=1 Tax=Irpex rosettiformis TaxID=378272 RepID=A0ACB8U943_9APHY|nr:hypothetical protein BDY19DRAFT_937849 [Irpex rosettiformis]